jgi:hypothetical protein
MAPFDRRHGTRRRPESQGRTPEGNPRPRTLESLKGLPGSRPCGYGALLGAHCKSRKTAIFARYTWSKGFTWSKATTWSSGYTWSKDDTWSKALPWWGTTGTGLTAIKPALIVNWVPNVVRMGRNPLARSQQPPLGRAALHHSMNQQSR